MPAVARTSVEFPAPRFEVGLRPPLKWAGGKRWQIPHLRPLWEPHRERRLVEPFCGGLAVALGLGPERALLNDANPHLVSFYKWLQRGLTIEPKLKLRNEAVLYYSHRERFNRLVGDGRARTAEAAALFYFLNRTGYNGLCRFNQSGAFNVPFGRYRAIQYLRDFGAYRAQFSDWTFSNVDVTDISLRREDFVYADPPYDVEFAAQGGFGWPDQLRTAEWLASHPGPVILVNQATDRIVRLYRALAFHVTFLEAPRRADRPSSREVMATRGLTRA
jgi:DNA adenine methylase